MKQFSKSPKISQVHLLPYSEINVYLIYNEQYTLLFKNISYFVCESVTCARSQELYLAECSTVSRTPALRAGDLASPSPFLWSTENYGKIKSSINMSISHCCSHTNSISHIIIVESMHQNPLAVSLQ